MDGREKAGEKGAEHKIEEGGGQVWGVAEIGSDIVWVEWEREEGRIRGREVF
jgi:hypothetical protein